MKHPYPLGALIVGLVNLSLVAVVHGANETPERSVDFQQDVRPILSDHCFACHGPDSNHRKADLRLDDRQVSVDTGAIAPGQPEESELMRRILSEDPDDVMPPPDANKKLSEAQKEVLSAWIQQGAEYEEHWSFVAPQKPEVPEIAGAENPIDAFIRNRLEGNADSSSDLGSDGVAADCVRDR